MDEFDFTEDEIREQLEILGYQNVPTERLREFKRDLDHLIKHERSKNSSLFSTSEQSSSDSDIQRVRHLNGHGRPPFEDINHRTNANGNSTSAEHSKYGKENIYIVHPTVLGEGNKHKIPEASQHTQATLPQYTLYGDDRLHEEQEEDTSIDSITTTSTDRRIIKRKTLRKHNGHSEIFETESESGDMDSLQEAFRNLPISVDIKRPSTAPGYGHRLQSHCLARPHSAMPDYAPAYRLPDDFEGPKALIKPMKKNPHMKNVKKADPVSKFHKYNHNWQCHRAPGEKQHKGLRWSVREQMLYHDQVVDKKAQKVFVPNNYTIPSEKKRKNLRWQIRNDMAQGVVPPSAFD